ncbi:hypothetical protein uvFWCGRAMDCOMC449_052 [Freshwater phage uvFW-CGR-AMD-COM-C449]|jgi:hypothetical protein|nr:hypothetical protein uvFWCGRAMDCOMC449_052 [Freshwater phage uvFW-CGR-AMD-COM-C449]
MSNAQDFLNTIPSLLSVRSRLAVFASNTEAGELNTLLNDAYQEMGRLQIIIDNMAERNQKQNAEQLRIVRAVEADRDKWRNIAKGDTNE